MSSSTNLKLKPNNPIMVEILEDTNPQRVNGFLIGNFNDEFLILGGFQDGEFDLGDVLIVRMLVGNEIMGFQTEINRIIDFPQKIYITSYPEISTTINLRKSERIKIFIPTDVKADISGSSEGGKQFIKAWMLNISQGGCYFSSKSILDKSVEIHLTFSLPGATKVHSLSGQILECNRKNGSFAQRAMFPENIENTLGLDEISNWISQNSSFAIN